MCRSKQHDSGDQETDQYATLAHTRSLVCSVLVYSAFSPSSTAEDTWQSNLDRDEISLSWTSRDRPSALHSMLTGANWSLSVFTSSRIFRDCNRRGYACVSQARAANGRGGVASTACAAPSSTTVAIKTRITVHLYTRIQSRREEASI
jgi:hypothetical protein